MIQVAIHLIVLLLSVTSFAVGPEEMGDYFHSAEEVLQAVDALEEKIPWANCETSRVLLADYMAVIEKYRDNPNTLFSGNAYFSEQAIYHVRLAHIARHQGQESEAVRHEAEAVSSCNKADWSSCELPVIQKVVTAMNRTIKGKCF